MEFDKDIHIESVCKNDADFLYGLMNIPSVLQDLNEIPTNRQDWVDAVNAWLSDEDEEDHIVFFKNTPIGWLGINGLLSKDKTAYLKMAVFLPEYQGRGVGAFAIKQLMSGLKDRGYEKIILYTDSDNHKAQSCYKKCGFQIVDSLTETVSNGKSILRVKMESALNQ